MAEPSNKIIDNPSVVSCDYPSCDWTIHFAPGQTVREITEQLLRMDCYIQIKDDGFLARILCPEHAMTAMRPKSNDNVNHPSHYTDGKIEVWDFIVDKKLDFLRGSAVKYISRAGKKDSSKEIEDLKKAVAFINRAIQELEQEKGN